MNAIRLAALTAASLAFCAAPSFAQVIYCSPVFHQPIPPAPDACGPGFYAYNSAGVLYGPNYYLRPCFPPFNGLHPCFGQRQYRPAVVPVQVHPHQPPQLRTVMVPTPQMGPALPPIHTLPHLQHAQAQQPKMVTFPSHPFVRSPRDFFMWGEAMEDELSRLRHPSLIP